MVATDGRLDDRAPPSVGYVVWDAELGMKVVGYAVLPDWLRASWDGEDGIALVEEAAILLALQQEGVLWTTRDVV